MPPRQQQVKWTSGTSDAGLRYDRATVNGHSVMVYKNRATRRWEVNIDGVLLHGSPATKPGAKAAAVRRARSK